MYLEKNNPAPRIEEATVPTYALPFFTRIAYISQKLIHFIWRYRDSPRYMLTYIRFIANSSYRETVHFMGEKEFIEAAKKRSTLRLQDGEFTLLLGKRDLWYERKNDRLISMWHEAISTYNDSSPYILGLPPYILIDNKTLHVHAFKYLWMPAKIFYRLLFPKIPKYFNGSYFYINNTSIPFMQKISQGSDVLLVSNMDVINATRPHEENFFKNARSVDYVETPAKNAFSQYESIVRKIESHLTQDTVLFMACGPAGKAMIYDLAKKGIRAHDIGYGLTGAYTGESREHFLKWEVFGPLYHEAQKQNHAKQ